MQNKVGTLNSQLRFTLYKIFFSNTIVKSEHVVDTEIVKDEKRFYYSSNNLTNIRVTFYAPLHTMLDKYLNM